MPARHERRRADERRLRTDERERLDQRSRDARMENVADDRNVKAVEPAERLAHRVEVEKRLRRMLVLPVSGVDDVGVRHARDEIGSTDVRMTDHDHVRVVLGKRQRGVLQRLTLVDGRAGRSQRHRVGREPLRRQVEARERARRRLVEEIDDETATQRRQLLHLAVEGAGDGRWPFRGAVRRHFGRDRRSRADADVAAAGRPRARRAAAPL